MPNTSTATESNTGSRYRMPTKVRRDRPAFKKGTLESASVRLHQVYGDSPATWQNRMFGAASDYQQVARMNTELRALGLEDKVAELMVPIFASVAERDVPHWTEAIHLHNAADANEDIGQAEWIKNTSDENLDGYIGKLARDVRAAEILLASLEAERQRRREAKP